MDLPGGGTAPYSPYSQPQQQGDDGKKRKNSTPGTPGSGGGTMTPTIAAPGGVSLPGSSSGAFTAPSGSSSFQTKIKKSKLPRNLDKLKPVGAQRAEAAAAAAAEARQQIIDNGGVPPVRPKGMIKGPYKKREKKDVPPKKITKAAMARASATSQTFGNNNYNINNNNNNNYTSGVATSSTLSTPNYNNNRNINNNQGNFGSPLANDNRRGMGTEDYDDDENGDGPRGSPRPGMDTDAEGRGEDGNGADGGPGGGSGGATPANKDDDDDDQDEDHDYTEFDWAQEESNKGESKEELKALLDCFSEEQLQRYEIYRRAALSRVTMKKLVAALLNQQVSPTMVFVVGGFCKVFVGEMVEKAREVMEDWGDTGQIRPEHLREAQRRYKREEVARGKGVRTVNGYKRHLFTR